MRDVCKGSRFAWGSWLGQSLDSMTNTDTTQTTRGYMNADGSMRPSPWSYCLFIIVAVLPICILSSEFVQAQGRPELRGISKVKVDVLLANVVEGNENLPSDISESRLRTIIELKLRTAGLRVLSAEESLADPDTNPWVVLAQGAMPATLRVGERLAGYFVSTNLTVFEYRYLAARDAVLPVQLWEEANLRTTPLEEAAAQFEGAVAILLDDFLNDWLAANPRR